MAGFLSMFPFKNVPRETRRFTADNRVFSGLELGRFFFNGGELDTARRPDEVHRSGLVPRPPPRRGGDGDLRRKLKVQIARLTQGE